MADPVTLAMAVATAVVGKVAQTLTEKGQGQAGPLRELRLPGA